MSLSEESRQFEAELSWCLEKLQLSLEGAKSEKQTKDTAKAINTLQNPKAPLIKKRQVMRINLGDYRHKMAAEDKAFKLDANVKKANASKLSKFLRKHKDDSSNGAKADDKVQFKFDFNKEADEPEKPTEKFKYVASDNSFKFNFDICDSH